MSAERLFKVACSYVGSGPEDFARLEGSGRPGRGLTALRRRLVWWVMRNMHRELGEYQQPSYPEIAEASGMYVHSTVVMACHKMDKWVSWFGLPGLIRFGREIDTLIAGGDRALVRSGGQAIVVARETVDEEWAEQKAKKGAKA